MATTYTPNADLALMATGDQVDNWGVVQNNAIFTPIDGILGATASVAMTSSDVTLTLTQWQSMSFLLTGILTANLNLIFPISPADTGGGTLAVGGLRVIDNQTTGNFTVTVKTAASGSTGVSVPQATRDPNNTATIIATARTIVYSDTVNVGFSDDRIEGSASLRIPTFAGNPNTNLVGTAPTALTPGSLVQDRTNGLLYTCTTTGIAANAVWSAIAGGTVAPQGYLTPVSNTPIILTDAIAQTTIFYVPYVGGTLPVYSGSFFAIYILGSQLSLPLTNQAANQIFDVFGFVPSGATAPIIGTGPAWANATAGSCTRGTGAGTTEITRVLGQWTNANQITATNNGVTYTVAANRGTYLGSLFIDSTNGQVSCYRSFGQSRKWGVWNAYNRDPIYLKVGDSTPSWNVTSSTIGPANANTANSLTVFSGLAEEIFNFQVIQKVQTDPTSGSGSNAGVGIGWNSTSAYSGTQGSIDGGANGAARATGTPAGAFIQAPSLGINVANFLENGVAGRTFVFFGTEANMSLNVFWRG